MKHAMKKKQSVDIKKRAHHRQSSAATKSAPVSNDNETNHPERGLSVCEYRWMTFAMVKLSHSDQLSGTGAVPTSVVCRKGSNFSSVKPLKQSRASQFER